MQDDTKKNNENDLTDEDSIELEDLSDDLEGETWDIDDDLEDIESFDDLDEGLDQSFADDAEFSDKPPKRKSNVVTIAIIAFVLVAAGFAYLNFFGGTPSDSTDDVLALENNYQPEETSSEQEDGLEIATFDAPPMPTPMDGQMAEDTALLPEPGEQILDEDAGDGMMARSTENSLEVTEELTPLPGQAPAQMSLEDEQEPQDLETMEVAEIEAQPPQEPQDNAIFSSEPDELQPTREAELDEALPADTTSYDDTALTAQVQSLTSQMSRVSEQNNRLEQEISEQLLRNSQQLENVTSALQSLETRMQEQVSALTSANERLESKIETIENQSSETVEAMQREMARMESVPAQEPQATTSQTQAEESSPVLKTASKPKEAERTATQNPDIPVQKKSAPEKTERAVSQAAGYVLKSATPNSAIVSSKATGDVYTLEIGTTLRGIGKVTAIKVVDGRWVVQGTQGEILQ